MPNTSYTDSEGRWVSLSDTTLYARWGSGTTVTLPTISKTNYTCGWTTSTSTSSIMYGSGYSGLVPTANMTLYGVCVANTRNVKVNFAGSGVSSVTFTASGQTSRTVTSSGGTANLAEGVQYTVTMNLTTGNTFDSWTLNSSSYGSAISSKTLTSANSNVSSTFNTPTYKMEEYVDPYVQGTGYQTCDSTYGAWYEYYTATAGTVTNDSSAVQSPTDAVYDICPKGWRLPTKVETQGIIAYTEDFSPTYGGAYLGGSRDQEQAMGFWWTSTLEEDSSIGNVISYALTYTRRLYNYSYNALNGFYVRCVLK